MESCRTVWEKASGPWLHTVKAEKVREVEFRNFEILGRPPSEGYSHVKLLESAVEFSPPILK